MCIQMRLETNYLWVIVEIDKKVCFVSSFRISLMRAELEVTIGLELCKNELCMKCIERFSVSKLVRYEIHLGDKPNEDHLLIIT